MIINFDNVHQFKPTGNRVIDFFFGFVKPMCGDGSQEESIDCAIGYLQIGSSPHAKIYAHTYLHRIGITGVKLVEIESAMVQYFCNIFFNEISGIKGYFKYKVRIAQLRKKIYPRSGDGIPFIIILKNIYMNLKEGRGFATVRGE